MSPILVINISGKVRNKYLIKLKLNINNKIIK